MSWRRGERHDAGLPLPGPIMPRPFRALAVAFTSLPNLSPSLQWRLVSSAMDCLRNAAPRTACTAFGPVAGFAVTGTAWYLAWAAVMIAAAAGGRRLAASFARRPPGDSPHIWARHYATVSAAQAGVIGLGAAAAMLQGNPVACLLCLVPIGAAAAAYAAQGKLLGPARTHLILLLAPITAAGFATRSPPLVATALLAAVELGWTLGLARGAVEEAVAAPASPAPGVRQTSGAGAPTIGAELQRLLGRCQVTGMPNRHSFIHVVNEESLRAHRAGSNLSLLLVQWDDYERLADAEAPEAVDAALTDLARRLRPQARRPTDFVGNLGGGRFGVLLPGTDALGAAAVARNVQAAAKAADFDAAKGVMGVCAALSIGVATYCGKGMLLDDQLLTFAEEALNSARRTGGDKVARYDPMTETLRPPRFAGTAQQLDAETAVSIDAKA